MEKDSERSRQQTDQPKPLLAFGLVLVGVVFLLLAALTTFLMLAGPD